MNSRRVAGTDNGSAAEDAAPVSNKGGSRLNAKERLKEDLATGQLIEPKKKVKTDQSCPAKKRIARHATVKSDRDAVVKTTMKESHTRFLLAMELFCNDDDDDEDGSGQGRGVMSASTSASSTVGALSDADKRLRPGLEKDDDADAATAEPYREEKVIDVVVADEHWHNEPPQERRPGAYAVSGLRHHYDDDDESWCSQDSATVDVEKSERDSNKITPGYSCRSFGGGGKLSSLPRALMIDSLEDDETGPPAHLPAATVFDPKAEASRIKRSFFRQSALSVAAGLVFATAFFAIGMFASQWPISRSRLAMIEDALRKNHVLDVAFSGSHGFVEALAWITFDDSKQVQPADSHLKQRFLLAATYFATQSENQSWDYCARSTPGYDDFCIGHRNSRGKRWLSGHSECSWLGVKCKSGVVSELNLEQFGLHGPFPHSLAAIDSLTSINLARNALSGTIPSSFFALSLAYVLLHHNNLSGTAEGFGGCPDLVHLSLSNNRLTGTIPEFTSRALAELSLSSNNLSGSVPATIGNLPRLETLLLGHNALDGTIPSSIGQLQKLQHFHLEHNSIEGSVPESLFSCKNLLFIDLTGNQMHGTLPSHLWNLPKLQAILLSGNSFSGSLPANDEPLMNLKFISISGNRLSGTFPESICLGKALTAVEPDCSENGLVGSAPQQLKCSCCSSCCATMPTSRTTCEV